MVEPFQHEAGEDDTDAQAGNQDGGQGPAGRQERTVDHQRDGNDGVDQQSGPLHAAPLGDEPAGVHLLREEQVAAQDAACRRGDAHHAECRHREAARPSLIIHANTDARK